jgi:hypothetical protein
MRRYGVVLALAVMSFAVWAMSAAAISSPKVFNLLDVASNVEQPIGGYTFEQPPVGGDQFAINDILYKWAGTKKGVRVGRVQGIGTFQTGFGANFTRPATVMFVVQAYLPGGTVVLQGYGHVNPGGPSQFTFPVVGGTGVYANVRGYVKTRDLGNGDTNNTNVEFHLLP